MAIEKDALSKKNEKKMKHPYFKSIMTVGSLHKLFLESIKMELGRKRIRNISPMQCLAIYTMGKSSLAGKASFSYEDLYGLYQSLVSSSELTYILKKLMRAGHIVNKYGDTDKRKKVYVLSEKGWVLYDKVDILFDDYLQNLEEAGLSKADLRTLSRMALKLQRVCQYIILPPPRDLKEK